MEDCPGLRQRRLFSIAKLTAGTSAGNPHQLTATIYLHWAATPYSWVRSGFYHTIIGGDGTLHRLHAYSIYLPAHTWVAPLRVV